MKLLNFSKTQKYLVGNEIIKEGFFQDFSDWKMWLLISVNSNLEFRRTFLKRLVFHAIRNYQSNERDLDGKVFSLFTTNKNVCIIALTFLMCLIF